MADRSPTLFWMGVAMLAISWTAFSLRVYTRGVLMKTFGWDDWLMGLTVFFFSAYIACQFGGIHYGTGRHLADLTPENAQRALEFWWFCEVFYIPCAAFLKLSVGVFLARIAERPMHLWILRFMMVSTGLFGGTYFLLAIFQCKPIDAWWVRKHDLAYRNYGSCMNNTAVVATSLASAGLNSLADWTFGILPIFIVKDLQMPRRQKRLVAAILSLASVACIATIVRMPFILNLARDDDFLYETVDIAIWSNVEPGIGIAAACAATLRPLLKQVLGTGGESGWFSRRTRSKDRYYSSSGSSGSKKHGGSSHASYALRDGGMPHLSLRPDYVGNYTEITTGNEDGYRPSVDGGSGKKEPTVSGRELKDAAWALESRGGSDARQATHEAQTSHLQKQKQGQRSDTFTVRSPDTNTATTNTSTKPSAFEIQKSVEFTFVEEVEDIRQHEEEAGLRHPASLGGAWRSSSNSLQGGHRQRHKRTAGWNHLPTTHDEYDDDDDVGGLGARNHFGLPPPPPLVPVLDAADAAGAVSPPPSSRSRSYERSGSGGLRPPRHPSAPQHPPSSSSPSSPSLSQRPPAPPRHPGTSISGRSNLPPGKVGDPFASWR